MTFLISLSILMFGFKVTVEKTKPFLGETSKEEFGK